MLEGQSTKSDAIQVRQATFDKVINFSVPSTDKGFPSPHNGKLSRLVLTA